MVFDTHVTQTIKQLLERFGVSGPVRVLTPVADDEAIFLVPTAAAALMNERELTIALTNLLKRKVWVTTDGPEWSTSSVSFDV